MRALKMRTVLAAGILGLAVAGCGGGSSSGGTGTLGVSLTDAPACGFDAVNVTVQKVRVHQSNTAAPTDAGWTDITLASPMRVDLLSLNNGILAFLGQTPLPAGRYQQMRLVLAPNSGSNPLANSVTPTGMSAVPLTTPSAVQSGVKMNVDINVAANQMVDVVIDFNACKSVVTAGASGMYLLKPVLTVTPQYISGILGYVAPALANGNTSVSLQDNTGTVVKATVPDSTGKFLLQPVAPGTYTLVVTAPNTATAVVTGVVVADGTVTSVDASANPISPPGSPTATLKGAVTTGTTPIDASVTALQTFTLSGGGTIEVDSMGVDSVTGAYLLTVPVAAPVVAPFVAPPAMLNFSADGAVAGNYTLQAASSGATKSAGPITLTAGAMVTTNFTFP